jgi:hypothetical protein
VAEGLVYLIAAAPNPPPRVPANARFEVRKSSVEYTLLTEKVLYSIKYVLGGL